MLDPKNVSLIVEDEEEKSARFVLRPLPAGFGRTIGNSLRRVLLSSIEGAAVTEARFSGVPHQFTTIDGVKEDVVQLILNLKKLRLRIEGETAVALSLLAKGTGEVTAGDLEVPAGVEIINKDLVLATLTSKDAKLEAELLAEKGYGFVPSEEGEKSRVGAVLLDAAFSPVKSVSCKVEKTRAGDLSNLDSLEMQVKTDGTISPREAFLEASEYLMKYFYRLTQGEQEVKLEEEKKKPLMTQEEKQHPLEDLELPTRVTNSLKAGGVTTCGDLMEIIWEEGYEALKEIPKVGEKSVEEIKKRVRERGWVKDLEEEEEE
ncbi:MAG: DNA-directed RNA polymerase subunit alpha [Patescibacteria group bacterium]|nr:DNA-directed RNA polymerase subunit alpha [Patescibacteria group bacterium]